MTRDDDARRKFEGDVFYEAWARGLNPDRAVECASDCYYDRRTPSECVDGFARQERRAREARELARQEEEYLLAEQEREYYRQMEEGQGEEPTL